MKLSSIVEKAGFELLTAGLKDHDVSAGLVSDLLSHVLSQGKAGMIWITVQRHINIIAVASSVDIQTIVISGKIRPSEEVIEVASSNGINLFYSDAESFGICGRVYGMLKDEVV